MLDKSGYFQLVSIANEAIRTYYGGYENKLSDAEYDEIILKIREYEEAHPNEISSQSPTLFVGNKVRYPMINNKHLTKMYSMDNVFDYQQMVKWLNKFSNEKVTFSVMPKYDGCAINLIYNNGELVNILSRGDGNIGENCQDLKGKINNIPKRIGVSGRIEVRGEIVISKENFKKVNDAITINFGTEGRYSNPRNLVAGKIMTHSHTYNDDIVKLFDFYPWGLGYNELKLSTYSEQMEFIGKWFKVEQPVLVISSDYIEKIYNEYVLNVRDNLPVNIDGLVIRVNELNVCDKYGYTLRYPKFMVAYKFPPKVEIAHLIHVTEQIGRTGVITPVAIISPTTIDGVTITRVTLHNYNYIKAMDYRIGDYVKVTRSGDVIPKIIGKMPRDENLEYIKIIPPSKCGYCLGPITKINTEHVCENRNCTGRLKMKLSHFASKDAMNISGMGDKLIDWLVSSGKVTKLSDIYKLTYDDLKLNYGDKDKTINNILEAIEKSKNVTLENFIFALGINTIGKGKARMLATRYGLGWVNIDHRLTNLPVDTSVTGYIRDNMSDILELYDILNIEVPIVKSSKLLGKTFAITGKLSKPRKYYESIIISNGGTLLNDVNYNTDYLICGNNPSSKLTRANAYEVKVISENEFNDLL